MMMTEPTDNGLNERTRLRLPIVLWFQRTIHAEQCDPWQSSVDSEARLYRLAFERNVDDYVSLAREAVFRYLETRGDDTLFESETKNVAATLGERQSHEKEISYLVNQQFDPLLSELQSTIRCGKCHSDRIRITWAQTKSADEGQTVKFECQNCPHCWVFAT